MGTSPAVDVRHLRLLVALDDVGSLNAAARRLHLTPSALSQQLRELEDRLGGPLFHRQWRRLVLTDAGRRMTEAARTLLGELVRAEAETRSLLRGTSGTIRITTGCHQSYRWLPELLADYAAAWPGVEVTVVAEAGDTPAEWLIARKLDVALVACAIARDPRVRVARLFRDELVAVVGRGHPWAGLKKVDVRRFAGEHLWADADALQRDTPLTRAFQQAGNIAPRKLTGVPTGGGVPLEMARANLGITLMPLWTVEPLLAGGDLHAVRVGARGLWLEWSIATRAEEHAPPLAAFLAALRTHHPRARALPTSRMHRIRAA
jgi:LysR family transcriptional regulator for metE and metH